MTGGSAGAARDKDGHRRQHPQQPRRWHSELNHNYRIYFATLLICSTCAITVYCLLSGWDGPSSWRLRTRSTSRWRGPTLDDRSALTTSTPLRTRCTAEGGLDSLATSDRRRLDEVDYETIFSNALPLFNTIAPIFMHHLLEANVSEPYDRMHLVSAFLDPRPLVVPNGRREILMHGVLNGGKNVKQSEPSYPDGRTHGTVLIRQTDGTLVTTSGSVKSLLAYDRMIGYMTLSLGQFICSLAKMPEATYDAMDWANAEIYATINPLSAPPPNDVFIRVRPIAALDLDEHRTGRGQGGVCIAPLRGDMCAPSIRDHISYQRSLGFTRIYAYILDPGPITLSIMRELAATDPEFVPIRWGLPLDWSVAPETDVTHMIRDFQVDPSEWDLPGVDALHPAKEALLGVAEKPQSVGVWYWGQNLAAQDCQMRAMADGVRWVAVVDWDEYLVMQPSDKLTWSPPSRFADPIAAMEPFLQWARQVPRPSSFSVETGFMLYPDPEQQLHVHLETVAQGMLPSAILFANSFGEDRCRTRNPPPQTRVLKEVMDRFGAWD
ncbi:BQ2448_2757 [Microbotryum intermedium]|uniref:BQ2448_2757 protein n=1 Tax=Microbotryum intermedium TaxID=269621 RepID=A0A238FEE4_9BASI|nr:BQ2448_2757 [Microbotryum intermedium]